MVVAFPFSPLGNQHCRLMCKGASSTYVLASDEMFHAMKRAQGASIMLEIKKHILFIRYKKRMYFYESCCKKTCINVTLAETEIYLYRFTAAVSFKMC